MLNTFQILLIATPLIIALIGGLSIDIIEIINDKKNNQ